MLGRMLGRNSITMVAAALAVSLARAAPAAERDQGPEMATARQISAPNESLGMVRIVRADMTLLPDLDLSRAASRHVQIRFPKGERLISTSRAPRFAGNMAAPPRDIRAASVTVPLPLTQDSSHPRSSDSSHSGLPGGLLMMAGVLGAARDTRKRDAVTFHDPVAAGKTCFAGGLAVLNAAGDAEPGTAALAKRARGRFAETIDNLAGAAGDLVVKIERGCFQFANSGADPITRADIGAVCYIEDDETVSKTDAVGTRSAAGTIRDVDAGGVWVEI